MPQFESGIVQVNSSVGTISSIVWNPSNTSTTTFGSLGSVPAASVLTNVIVANTGTNSIYVGMGSIASSTPTLGAQVAAGGYLLFSGYTGTVGTAGTIWAQAAANASSSTMAGMASVIAVS